MEIGLIEWFNEDKKFGLIRMYNGSNVILHSSNWKDPKKLTLENKLPLIFSIGLHKEKTTAINCKYFDANSLQDWNTLLNTKENNFLIKFENSEVNLLQRTVKSLKANVNYSTITEIFKNVIGSLSEIELFNNKHWIYETYQNLEVEVIKLFVLKLIKARVNQLSDEKIFQFWRDNILSDFEPKDTFFTRNFNDVTNLEIELIKNRQIRYIVIIKKTQHLSENFNLQTFLQYDYILNLIDNEKLKNKILKDLSKIAINFYLSFVSQKIESLTNEKFVKTFFFKEILNNQPKFINNDILNSIKAVLEEKIKKNCSFKIIIESWKEGLLEFDKIYFTSFVKEQNPENLKYLLRTKKANSIQIDLILEHLFKLKEYELILTETKSLSANYFENYDRIIFESINEQEYFHLWQKKIGKILPSKYLALYLNHIEENYINLYEWIQTNTISIEDAKSLIFSKIQETPIIDNRFKFSTLYNAIFFLLKIGDTSINKLLTSKNTSILLILWHLKISDTFNFETLKGKFIYFKPKEQVKIFKRLFYLKHRNKIDFDLKKLDEILRADVNLYIANKKFDNDFVLDISTHIIIECLKSYVKTGSFIFESKLILEDLKSNSEKKFKIEHYFDKCQGRSTPVWDWNTHGEISKKIIYSNNKKFEFFKVVFKYDIDIVNSIKKLPQNKRKYNPDEKFWGVSLSCETELFQIAKEHNLFIKLPDGRHYDNNLHLVDFPRNIKVKDTWKKNIPNGITFCEGRKAKKEHNRFKRKFWWCTNQACFENCVQDHLKETNIAKDEEVIWEQYTLFDFLKILNISVDEHNGLDLIKDGQYYKFLGHINAFNRLLEKLYCVECNNLIYPIKTSHFALYRDTRFCCIQEDCINKHKEIYLNHCLYGECKTIIDSRISKKCSHGLYICNNCGTCCSESLFKRRLENMIKVGGYIHEDLLINVKNQNGHLEKKEYYCYSCSEMMTEVNEKTYECKNCNVKYDLNKFKWLYKKWIRTNKRRKDYPTYVQRKN